jgi:hypothetical protein
MGAWTIAQLVVFAVGFLLAFTGEKLSIPILMYGGISLFGCAALLISTEAIITQQIVLGPRRYNETYVGLPAVAQGIQFGMLGMFFIGVSFAAYFNSGDALFDHFVRRPGLMLVMFGVYCLMQAVIAIGGYQEEKQGPRWIVVMNLLASRLLPGIILIVIGLGATGLGLIDAVAPALFDKMGGGFLETLYGLKP